MTNYPYYVNDFIEIQRKSFHNFLKKGILEEFSKRNPITNTKKNLEFLFYPEYYKLSFPEYNIREAILKMKSYTSKLYMPVQLTDRKAKKIKIKWVFLVNLPLMTKRGHFLLNGGARVIVNQILRSPGIYFQEKIHEIYRNKWSEKPNESFYRYYADFICLKGTWLRLEIDKEKLFWAQMKKGPKIPLFWFLLAMGINEKTILTSITDSKRLLKNLEKYNSKNISKEKNFFLPSLENLFSKRTLSFLEEKTRETFSKRKERGEAQATNPPFKPFKETSLSKFFLKEKRITEKPLLKKFSFKNNIKKNLPFFNKQDKKSYVKKVQKSAFFSLDKKTKEEKILNKQIIWKKIFSLARQTNLTQPNFKEFLFLRKTSSKNTITENGRKWLFNKFFNPRTYDLSKQGRLSLNKKLGLFLNIEQITLTPQDVLFATNCLIKVEKKLKPIDDIDHLKNRRVRTSGELLQIQLGIGLLRLEKSIREKMNKSIKTPLIKNLINTKTLNGAFKEFFGSSQLSQFMDQINPLAEITHKRRLTSLGPGGVTRDTATLAIRGIHPTHYGRICPIETPEGKNTGLVNSITTYAHVNSQGLVVTPFYKVVRGQVQKKAGLFFLSAEQEEKVTVAAADVNLSSLGFLPKSPLPTRIGDEFTKISRNSVEFLSQSSFQMISIATSLIPFLEHDDANRTLMGSNMQRQAVPLIRPQLPIVGTGLEARVVSDSGHILQANKSGVIVNVTSEKILIYNIIK